MAVWDDWPCPIQDAYKYAQRTLLFLTEILDARLVPSTGHFWKPRPGFLSTPPVSATYGKSDNVGREATCPRSHSEAMAEQGRGIDVQPLASAFQVTTIGLLLWTTLQIKKM